MGSPLDNFNLTPIQEFYCNTNIFITGVTGFFGRTLLEKLLRACPNISKIYVLIRNKKGKDPTTRVQEILDDILFQGLKEKFPNFGDLVVGINGDCSLPNLGLSSEDMDILKKEVNIIFHLAATVKFTEKLKIATFINIRATRDIINLARQMPKLKVVMHVSSAFANCTYNIIEEKLYPAALDGDTMITMAENLPDDILDDISKKLLKSYPNTYTFTKQIAENIVKKYSADLPIGIHRPAIAISTYKEPIKSWINNLYAVTGIVGYMGLGIIRAVTGNLSYKGNVVPIDMCVNSLIAATWDVQKTLENAKKLDKKFEIPIYHYESTNDKPITWGEIFDKSLIGDDCKPATFKILWFHLSKIQKNFLLYKLLAFFVHILPASISDLILFCFGKPPIMLKMYSKIHELIDVLSHFSSNEWTFKSNNIRNMINRMSKSDRAIFFADLRQLDWNEFLKTYYEGITLYAMKDRKEILSKSMFTWRSKM